ncbi:DnaA ATPase domain-containing protein, partial [Bifidobacterium animalis]|uniref:DnaA ATPase domain-containing protein n=1 Tax=Bifidobacterium animalis TaxID=28025 RepID=UPI001BCBC1FD
GMQGSFTPGVTGSCRDPVTHLNSNDTFDAFIQGDSNRCARTVAVAVAEGSGRDYNPLCIYGGSGWGKTHLLHAIGNYAVQNQKPRPRVLYVTSEEFTNDFIESIRTSGQDNEDPAMEKFYRKYREVDVLLIDDIKFLG